MTLKQQQAQLLTSIFSLTDPQSNSTGGASKNTVSALAGVGVYQHSLLANASRALGITFATTHSFLGEPMFRQLVKQFLQSHLKTDYDWGEVDQAFPAFIGQQSLENAAIISAVAELDFACHLSERSEDIVRDLGSLDLLSKNDAYQLTINYCAGFNVLKLKYPVDQVVAQITQLNEHSEALTLDDIAQQLAQFEQGEYYYLVWRPDFQAQYAQISLQEYHWLKLWQSARHLNYDGQLSIGEALDASYQDDFSIIDWLPKAIERQLINSISIIN